MHHFRGELATSERTAEHWESVQTIRNTIISLEDCGTLGYEARSLHIAGIEDGDVA